MELTGPEKRIQALFSELSLADRGHTPRFEHVWTQAVSRPAPVRMFGSSWAVAATLVVTVTCAFALWSKYKALESQGVINVAPLEIPARTLPQLAAFTAPSHSLHTPRPKRTFRPRQNDNTALTEAALLSTWQSPTQSFMQSPSSIVLNSLPQLNQSVKDLESFLPKNNQLIKESNQ